MRLTCPNCGAQYEVPDEVIPEDGRDVQCSNCGKTWFQTHADQAEVPAAAEADPPEVATVPAETTDPEDAASPDADEVGADADSGDDEDTPADEPGPVRRELDPKVSEILRQEAEHEARLRAQEQDPDLQSTSDQGIDATSDAPQAEPAERKPDDKQAAAAAKPAAVEAPIAAPESRRDLLPDVEEINSSLRQGDDPSAEIGAMDAANGRGRSSFTRGFALGLLIIGLFVLAYFNADVLVASLPQLDPVMSAYVGAVDQARVSFDSLLGALLTTPEI